MRRITLVSLMIVVALGTVVWAQQAARPLPPPVARLQAATEIERGHLRQALQKALVARQQLNVARARLKLPPLDPAVINRTKVPLLTVIRPGSFADIQINTTRDHFTVTGGNEQRGFLLTGTQLAARVSRPAGVRSLKPNDDTLLAKLLGARGVIDPISDIEIVKTEDGWDISFRRYGALYDLRMVCNDTTTTECAKEEALKLLADTQLLGGGQ